MTADIVERVIARLAPGLLEASRSIEAVIATMAPVITVDRKTGQVIGEVLDVRKIEIPDRVPLLNTHNRETVDSVIGSVVGLRRIGKTIVGSMVFVSGDEQIENIRRMVLQGHLTDVSVGARVLTSIMLNPGERRTIDGMAFVAGEIPLKVVTDWTIREVSIVSIGADQESKIRLSAPALMEA